MILEKLRQDFLDIYPSEYSIRSSYIKYLKTNENEMSIIKFISHRKLSNPNSHNIDFMERINWIPEKNILSTKSKYSFLLIFSFYRSIQRKTWLIKQLNFCSSHS